MISRGVKPGRIPSLLQFIVGIGMIAVAWVAFKDTFLKGPLEVKLFLGLWFFISFILAVIGLYNFISEERISEYDVEDKESYSQKEQFRWIKLWKIIVLILLPITLVSGELPVKLWVEPLTIPTYIVKSPDLNPMFYSGRAYQGAKGPVYPYPLLDKLTDVRKNKTYNAIYLENKYVKLCVLPEIGGRIFSAIDKTNNYDFFYHQHVIKPALIGMLGAWISGGVEWNFPHHHRATTFMAVDYTLKENSDGSKTIWVGEIEH
ncbi:MAG: DUF5107 domain-containing protein [Acidobacteriota bacterium]